LFASLALLAVSLFPSAAIAQVPGVPSPAVAAAPDAPQLVYGPKGIRLMTVADGIARIWPAKGDAGGTSLTEEAAMGCAAPIESAYFLPGGARIIAAHGPVAGESGALARAGTVVLPATGGEAVWRWPGLSLVIDGSGPMMSRNGLFALGQNGDTFRLLYLTRNGMGPIIRHPGVSRVALSPDGRYLLTGDAGGNVILWGTRNARQGSNRTLDGPVTTLGFSFDGKHAISGTGSGSSVWAVSGGAEVFLSDDPGAVFSPSDPFLLEMRGRSAVLRSVPEGTPLCTWRHKVVKRSDLGFTEAGNRVFIRGPIRSESWRVPGCETDKHRNTMMARPKMEGLTFSPDGSQALTVGGDMAGLWIFPSRKRPSSMFHHWPNPENGVYPVVFSPDGQQLLSATGARDARLISLPDGATVATLSHDANRDHCAAGAAF
jgi:hypothetical protein